ncbi:hypothetical protein [Paenibacillus polymyxa]|uniref:hypothetical protein n=1 Tax=Paenibacillus TaxID=44249 RepID=UPI00077C3BE2|nr:hypothetical protein AZE31_25290 [Paenibacillus polymyxa]
MVIEDNELELIETLIKACIKKRMTSRSESSPLAAEWEGIVVANITGLVSRYKNMITLKVAK